MDLRDYYWTTQPAVTKWFRSSPDILWTDIRQSLALAPDLLSLLLADRWKPHVLTGLLFPTQSSLLAWRAFLDMTILPTHTLEVTLPVFLLESLIPNLSVSHLHTKGIITKG